MEENTVISRRAFLMGSASCTIAAGMALTGCASNGNKDDANETPSDQDGQKQEENKEVKQPAQTPGTTIDNPIDVEYGQAITCDDATLTIDACDGFTDLFKGTDESTSMSLDEGKMFFLVRATLDYQGKTEVYPENSIAAKFVFEGDFEFSASVADTEKIVHNIQPLETRGITFYAQISQATAEKLSSPVMIFRVGKTIEGKSYSDGTFYRIAL